MPRLSGSEELPDAGNPVPAEARVSARGQGRKGVVVRPYREGDEQGIVRLFREVFGREMPLEEWMWKYRGQGNEEVFSAVAVDGDDRIVGHYGGVPVRCLFRGGQVRCLTSCDVMIQRSRRGFWALKRLIAGFVGGAMDNGFVTTHGFPTEETLMLPAEKLGIMERLARVYDARKKAVFHNNPTRLLYRLSPMECGDRGIDRLWETVRGSFDFIAVRDPAFYAWRFRDNPLHSYRLWGLRKRWSRNLEGIVVTKEDASEELSVMDILCRPDILLPLLQKTENLASAAGKKSLLLWMPERFHGLLKELGYELSYRCVLAQPVGKTFLPQSVIRSTFYFTMGDTDYL
jgi:hypothetical protein